MSIYITPLLKALGQSEKRKQNCKSQRSGRTWARLSSGHDRTAVFMSSQQLWLSEQGLHETRADNVLAQRDEER